MTGDLATTLINPTFILECCQLTFQPIDQVLPRYIFAMLPKPRAFGLVEVRCVGSVAVNQATEEYPKQ